MFQQVDDDLEDAINNTRILPPKLVDRRSQKRSKCSAAEDDSFYPEAMSLITKNQVNKFVRVVENSRT
jgi:RAB protein geranylgeranyltransferase component A